MREKAKGNAILRNLRAIGVDARLCSMKLTAVGPLFPEANDFASHRPVRDQVAALEKAVATALRAQGFAVLGSHSARVQADPETLTSVLAVVREGLGAPAA